jgi:hypothetical protein
MMLEGKGLVVDVSDFLHKETCSKWNNLKRAYYWLYRPLFSPLRLRVPYFGLDFVRTSYRLLFKEKRVTNTIGVAMLLVLAATIAITQWQAQNGRCVGYGRDGSQKTLYGDDCKW